MVYVFLADGFEEMEALCPIDIMRRAGIEVKSASITDNCYVTGTHGITVKSDITVKELTFDNVEGIVLPGGMPGTANLEKSEAVAKFIDYCNKNNLVIGAICAAPSILGKMELLSGKNATCFNGFEKDLLGANVVSVPAVSDGNTVTSWGAGAAFDFSYKLVEVLLGDNKISGKLSRDMRYPM
ncbi:MAG: DJ-1/PfpI family protein [Clostridia bacterium]|nr:DJ-1/PfpI family protein [Clostridia bacterium]